MNVPIKVHSESVYGVYVELLNPILKLKKREKELLVEYLKLHIRLGGAQEDLMNSGQKKIIRERIGMSEPSFNNHLKQLRDKQVFMNGQLNPLITSNLHFNDFDIKYSLIFENSQGKYFDANGQEYKEDNR